MLRPHRAGFRLEPRRHAHHRAARRRGLGAQRREDLDHQRLGVADIAVVWARRRWVVYGYLVERGTPGFTTSDIHGKWSMRASVTSSLALADCRVKEIAGCRAPKG
jgi:hypothetical protein